MTNALPLPLPQSPEFAAAMALLGQPVRIVNSENAGQAVLRWQIQSRRLGPLGRVDLISRGPVARDPDELSHWVRDFRRWQGVRPLLLNAETLAPDSLLDAGFWPMFTPATLAMLRLSDASSMRRAMHQKWRNRLNKTEETKLRITRHALDPHHWLIIADATQARRRGYRSLPAPVALAFAKANAGKAVVFEARHRGDPMAAVLILRHGLMATWQMGHVTAEGRKLNAMNATLWAAMTWLAEQGHRLLDLGTINTQDAPGIARFKLGTGASAQRLSGSWLHHPALAPIARHLPERLAA